MENNKRNKIALIIEIIAGLLFISASLFYSQITGAVIGANPAQNERIAGFIFAGALFLTSVFIWVKWKNY